MQSTVHRTQQQQAVVTHPLQRQAGDWRRVQHSHSVLVAPQTDHKLVDSQVVAVCILPDHIQADQLPVPQRIQADCPQP